MKKGIDAASNFMFVTHARASELLKKIIIILQWLKINVSINMNRLHCHGIYNRLKFTTVKLTIFNYLKK